MLLTLFLAKVIGVYMLVVGLAVLTRRRTISLAISALVEDKSTRLVIGMIPLLLGLLLVNTHNVWTSLPASLISLFGWAGIVKGLMYLFLKDSTLDHIFKMFTKRSWLMIDGALVVLVGLYLTGIGYGWF